MEISMKDTLRALRQKKGITQEALANTLGITPQSVGKWERGEGFPDITLLPHIALYFGVSIDDLLNVGQVRIDETIRAYSEESHRLKNIGDNEANLALWERASSEFPNDCRVLEGLMLAINREAVRPCPHDEAERIIALGERILAESTDSEIRERAVQTLCYTYDSIGDRENALRYADMGGNLYTTRADLRASVLNGEEGVRESQSYIAQLLHLAAMAASTMVGKADFTPAEEIRAYEFGIALWNLLFPDGNVGYYAHDISWRYSMIASLYAGMRDAERTLDALENSVRYAVIASRLKAMTYTAPMVNRMQYDLAESTKNYRGNACSARLSGLARPCYDFVRKTPRFRRAETELTACAETV